MRSPATRRDVLDRPATPDRPAWAIPRGLIVLLAAAAAVVTVAGVSAFSGVVGPVFLALILSVAVQPVQSWAGRRGLPAWVGLLASLAAVYSILVGLVLALVVSTAQLASQLPEYDAELDALLDGVRDALASVGIGDEQIRNTLGSVDLGRVVSAVEAVLQGAVGVFSNLLFVLALLLFMAVDGTTIGARMQLVARTKPEIAYALGSFAHGTRKYLVVSTVFGLVVAVLDGAALWLLGIPLPVLWALLSFITNYIPNVGFVLGLVPPALLGLLQGGVGLMVWVVVVYSVLNVVIQSVIQPKFVGDAVGLSATTTFLSLIFWAWVLGPLGAVLAVPLSLLVKALLLDVDPATRWVDALIGGGPTPSPGPHGKIDGSGAVPGRSDVCAS
ncbi:AI-2E family transporter [Rhodococcus sp. DMU1]|uniref:AI-2E family transporter n=1 Tax=Rhodococcus sp. DMU1 TaxID=2722825 RepID=UPI00143E40A6|nr:AI-2E family transporter [Rhodococcus sp. DMU1]QIX48279.1 AI-2E family transporter [Rhodococcus sp. DMU1]